MASVEAVASALPWILTSCTNCYLTMKPSGGPVTWLCRHEWLGIDRGRSCRERATPVGRAGPHI